MYNKLKGVINTHQIMRGLHFGKKKEQNKKHFCHKKTFLR